MRGRRRRGTSAAATCDGVPITPVDNVQAIIDAHPIKTTYCLAAGTYRVKRPIVPQRNDTLIGEPGTVIDGARPVTGWKPKGAVWTVGGRRQGPTLSIAGWGRDALVYPQSPYADDILVDGKPLFKVGVLLDGVVIGAGPETVGPGQYFIDYDADKITMGTNPAGHEVEQSYSPGGIFARAEGITIDGLTIQGTQRIGIRAFGTGWTILNSTVRANHIMGIDIKGLTQVVGNTIEANGELGITGQGDANVVDQNQIVDNDQARFGSVQGGCDGAGGAKFVKSTQMTVTNNLFADNWCTGLWIDSNSYQVTAGNNQSLRNRADGIRVEVSYFVNVHDNEVRDNAAAGSA